MIMLASWLVRWIDEICILCYLGLYDIVNCFVELNYITLRSFLSHKFSINNAFNHSTVPPFRWRKKLELIKRFFHLWLCFLLCSFIATIVMQHQNVIIKLFAFNLHCVFFWNPTNLERKICHFNFILGVIWQSFHPWILSSSSKPTHLKNHSTFSSCMIIYTI